MPLNVHMFRPKGKMLSPSGHLKSKVFWPQHKTWHLKGHTLKDHSPTLGKWVTVFAMIPSGFDM